MDLFIMHFVLSSRNTMNRRNISSLILLSVLAIIVYGVVTWQTHSLQSDVKQCSPHSQFFISSFQFIMLHFKNRKIVSSMRKTIRKTHYNHHFYQAFINSWLCIILTPYPAAICDQYNAWSSYKSSCNVEGSEEKHSCCVNIWLLNGHFSSSRLTYILTTNTIRFVDLLHTVSLII